MKKSLLVLTGLFMACLLFTSCQSSNLEIGTYKDEYATLKLGENNNFSLTYEGETISGEYEEDKDGKLLFEKVDGFNEIKMVGEIKDEGILMNGRVRVRKDDMLCTYLVGDEGQLFEKQAE